MNTHPPRRKSWFILIFVLFSGAASHQALAHTLVKLDATQLAPGPLEIRVNTGTISSNFTSAGAQIPVVANIAGVNSVQFIGTGGAGCGHWNEPSNG